MSRAGLQFLLKVAPKIDKAVIPRTNGRLSAAGIDKVGLVTTTGAKSGEPRTQPLAVIDDGDGLIAVASNYGRSSHPGWSYNLDVHPECQVEYRGPAAPYRAERLDGQERERAWATAVDFYAGYERYRVASAPRQIKLYRLRPTDLQNPSPPGG